MTLYDTIELIESFAAAQPSVNMIVENDIFKLNSCPDAKYGVFAFTQGAHSGSIDSDFLNFAFTLFYVDRLTADHSNQIEVQSVGVSTLDNILQLLYNAGVDVADYSFQPFNQRFSDECAGVFCSVTLQVPRNSVCADIYDMKPNIMTI